ncbi:MAG: 50S ribosomal protein L29 [Nitrospinota bacterium]
MRASELRQLSEEELREKAAEFRRELFNLNFRRATSQLENPMRVRLLRKDIARIETLLRERSLERGRSAGEASRG